MDCGFVDFNNFNIEEFEHFEKVENGDLTWLSHRTCAFAGPHNTHSSSVEGYYTLTPEDYVPHFKKRGVGMVIRLQASCASWLGDGPMLAPARSRSPL